jgi:uncharacterized membrane protein
MRALTLAAMCLVVGLHAGPAGATGPIVPAFVRSPMGLGFAGISLDGTTVFGTGSPLLHLDWSGGTLTLVPDDRILLAGVEVRALSGDGSVAVGTTDFYPNGRRAVRWEDGVVQELSSEQGYAYAVSADGSVILGSVAGTTMWVDGIPSSLGQLDGEDLYGSAVSADGRVVAGTLAGPEAFRWEDGVAERLGSVPGAYRVSSLGDLVSADGEVVGGELLSPNGLEAYRWEGGTFELLGDLPGGHFESTAMALSADGSVVVGRSWPEVNYTAFVWDRAHGMLALENLLRHGYGVDPGAVGTMDATGVSGDGQIVVGRIAPASGGELYIAAIPRSCNDGIDNDGDGLVDFPEDPGCSDGQDRFEIAAELPCDDTWDNDGDGLFDYPDDPGCASPVSTSESPACDDELDNDGDGGIDWDGGEAAGPVDPDCVGLPWRPRERPKACGLGAELALPLAVITHLLSRRRRRASSRRVRESAA